MSKVGVPLAGFAPEADYWGLSEKKKAGECTGECGFSGEKHLRLAACIVSAIDCYLTSHDMDRKDWCTRVALILARDLEEQNAV